MTYATAIKIHDHRPEDTITYRLWKYTRKIRITERSHKDGEPTYLGRVLEGSSDPSVETGELVWCYEHQIIEECDDQ